MNRCTLFQLATALLFSSIATGGCSGTDHAHYEEQVADLAQELPAGCTELDQNLITHVCAHPSSGPYQTIDGTTVPPVAVTADHYYVTLNFTSDFSSPFVGTASYSAAADDEYAIHYSNSSGTALTVRDAGGNLVNPVLTGANSTCSPALQAYKVYPLLNDVGKTPYTITFSRTASPKQVKFVVERLTPQSRFWYVDADSDTWGNSSTETVTFCAPPATHTVNRGLDCDDSNASVHPGSGCP